MKNVTTILYWAARLVAAAILAQTLFFKFTGAEESVFIFTTIGIEPWGRIGTGIMELIAVVLLLIPATVFLGALLAMGLMMGAIMMHITILGVVVKDDGGYLFLLAVVVTLCSAYVLYINTSRIISLLNSFRQKTVS